MTLLFSKASFFGTAILFGLSVGLAVQVPGASRIISASAAPAAPVAAIRAGAAEPSQVDRGTQSSEDSSQIALSGKQKRDLMKANFEKMKRDAGALADLAKALQEELNKSNENILSLDIVDKADKIEKLAKRIKGTARGF